MLKTTCQPQAIILLMAVMAALIAPMFHGAVYAVDYYVSPKGSDFNPGTLGAPFRTIQRGADAAQAGGCDQGA